MYFGAKKKIVPRTTARWSGRRDLNPQLPTWKDGTLPVELLPQMVEPAGIEPASEIPT